MLSELSAFEFLNVVDLILIKALYAFLNISTENIASQLITNKTFAIITIASINSLDV
jgi:hypothetical protein